MSFEPEDPAAFPFVALTLQTSGIHPATARIVRISALSFSADGEVGRSYHWLVNPGAYAGPQHLHGATKAELSQAPRFPSILRQLDSVLQDRILVVHDIPRTWGFVVAEARRAMHAAARSNRSRQGRRRRSVGKVPQPVELVDVLASARRRGAVFSDPRIRSLAQYSDISCDSAVASVHRALRAADEVAAEEAELVMQVFLQQYASHRGESLSDSADFAAYSPDALVADPFGRQFSAIRVEAMQEVPVYPNPGVYSPDRGLVRGMEVAIAPEVSVDPDILIARMREADITYAEKVTRTASLVVCNKTSEFTGKSMQADRKNIPLIGDTEFLQLLDDVDDPTAEEVGEALAITRIHRVRAPKSTVKLNKRAAQPQAAAKKRPTQKNQKQSEKGQKNQGRRRSNNRRRRSQRRRRG